MATFATNPTATFGSIIILSAVNKIETIVNNMRDEYLARKTQKELSKLTARQLEDIGLNYADIAKMR